MTCHKGTFGVPARSKLSLKTNLRGNGVVFRIADKRLMVPRGLILCKSYAMRSKGQPEAEQPQKP